MRSMLPRTPSGIDSPNGSVNISEIMRQQVPTIQSPASKSDPRVLGNIFERKDLIDNLRSCKFHKLLTHELDFVI